jgi:hypothetical protein
MRRTLPARCIHDLQAMVGILINCVSAQAPMHSDIKTSTAQQGVRMALFAAKGPNQKTSIGSPELEKLATSITLKTEQGETLMDVPLLTTRLIFTPRSQAA